MGFFYGNQEAKATKVHPNTVDFGTVTGLIGLPLTLVFKKCIVD